MSVEELAGLSPEQLCEAITTVGAVDLRGNRSATHPLDIASPRIGSEYRPDLVKLCVGNQVVFEKLTLALDSPDTYTRAIAATALADMGDRRAVSLLLSRLDKEHPMRQVEEGCPAIPLNMHGIVYENLAEKCMLSALETLGDSEAIPALAKMADRDEGARASELVAAISTIGQRHRPSKEAVAAMRHFESSSNAEIAATAKSFLTTHPR